MKNRKAAIFLALGIGFILAAVVFCVFNIVEDNKAGELSQQILKEIEAQPPQQMMTVGGDEFCGIVVVDKLQIELPVYNKWDYKLLKNAPCRYSGEIYDNDLIIAAHNFKSHFGKLKNLELDDIVKFIHADGTVHNFVVKEISKLDGTDVSNMKSGEWDLTLFTCTKGGKQRVTVRCERVKS